MADEKRGKKPKRRRHRGLRFLLVMLILIAGGGTAFYFGWVQFQLEAGEYGVIYTKSHGWEPRTLSGGEFEWRWQALLPTNLTLHTYRIQPRSVEIQRSGTLPSGDYYAAAAGGEVNFDWSIRAKIDYRVNPDTLHIFAAAEGGDSTLENLYSVYESRLRGVVSRLVDAGSANSDLPALERELFRHAAQLDSQILLEGVAVLDWSYPDLDLYDESRRLALVRLRDRQALIAELDRTALRRDDAQNARFDVLARYGELLDEHPVLLEFLALEGVPSDSLLPPLETQ